MANTIPYDTASGSEAEQPMKINPYPDSPDVPTEGDAIDRAMKYHYTLGDKSPGPDVIYNQIISGQENNLRTAQALQKGSDDIQYQNKMLNQYIAGHTGPITDQAVENFRTLTAPVTPNPKVDMEKAFSEKLVNDLYFTPTKNDLIQMAHAKDPEGTSGIYDAMKDITAHNEVVRKTIEDGNTNWKNQNFFFGNQYGNAKSSDILETIIPIKPWYDIVSESNSGKFFLGANLADMVMKGSMMPISQFEPWFKSTYDAINSHNPLDAQHFAEAFISYGTSDQFFDTAGNVADIASITPAATALRAVKGAFKGTAFALARAKFFDIPSLLSSAGRTEEAGTARVLRDFDSNFKQYNQLYDQITDADKSGEIKKITEGLPTFSNPINFTRDGSIREVSNAPDHIPVTYAKGPEGQLRTNITNDFIVQSEDFKDLPPVTTGSWSLTKDFSNGDLHAFTFRKEDIGEGSISIRMNPKNPKDIHVGLIEMNSGTSPGTKDIRNILAQLKQHFPEAETISGLRVSGARTGQYSKGMGLDEYPDVVVRLPKGKKEPQFSELETKGSGSFQGEEGQYNAGIHFEPTATSNTLDAPFTTRVNDSIFKNLAAPLKTLGDRNAVERLTLGAQQAAVSKAVDTAKREFSHIGDGVVDLHEVLPPETNAANIGQIALYLKQPNALPFATRAIADRFASQEYKLPTGSYGLENQGNDWYIKVIRPWDETHPSVRDQLIETGNSTPRKYFGLARSNEEILPNDMRRGGKTAVHGIQDQYKVINQITKPIRDLKGDSKRNFIRFTEALRDSNNGTGRLFYTMRDMETEWQRMFNVLPNVKEVVAYHAYLRAYEWNAVWRNLGIYRSLTRQGILDFTLAKEGGTSTSAFKGRFVDNINFDRNDGILIHEANGSPVFLRTQAITGDMKKAVQESIDSGVYKVIQVAAPQTMPLKADTGINDLVEFVISKDFKADRINPIQAPSRAAHIEYEEPFKIAQPRSMHAGGRQLYTHDTVVRKVNLSTDATEQATHYNEAQRLYRLKDQSFDSYVNNNLPHPGPSRLRAAFDSGNLSSTEPFVVTRRGESAWDSNQVRNFYQGSGVEPYHTNPNNLYQSVDRQYTGRLDRDLITGNGAGNEENPVFPLSQPKYIDPLATINRSSAALARNTFLEDYRIMAAEHFVQEFAPILKSSDDSLRNNPLASIFRDDLINENASRDLVMRAKNYQQAFKNFLHIRTDWDLNRGWMKEKTYEWLAQHIGEARADAIGNNKLLASIADPVHFVRSAAFVEHLSLFNPAQYFKQLQTFTHMTGIAGPVIAAKAMPASYLMRTLMLNIADRPGMIDHFAGMASTFGWNPEHFKEAYLAMRKTGLDIVEGEHAWKDDMSDIKLFQGKTGQWLDKSAIFFREGERQTRLASFNSAYLEWRGANPNSILDRRALQGIMLRQDLMNGNMTRASNAAWQSMGRGILSVPLQFATYPIRIMEQMIGNRLTTVEKTRLFLTYSAMYGIPVGLGITPLGIYPYYEELQKHLLEKGIVEDPNMAVEVLHKGLIETFLHMITGKQNDAGENLGVSGLQIVKNAFQGQFLDVALGASGSTVGGIIDSTFPIYHDFAGIFHEGMDGNGPLLAQDFADAMRNISSVNAIDKLYGAINYSKYVSRNGTLVTDMTPFDAVLSSVFGINPQDMDNISREIESNEQLKTSQQYYENQMVKYIQRGLNTDVKDTKTREAYFRTAETLRVLGDISPTQYSSILERAVKGKETLAHSINNSFFFKNVPLSQTQQRERALIELQNKNPISPVIGVRG